MSIIGICINSVAKFYEGSILAPTYWEKEREDNAHIWRIVLGLLDTCYQPLVASLEAS